MTDGWKRIKRCIAFASVLSALASAWGQAGIPTERIEKIYGSVFEVVTRKLDEGGLTYEKPLPLELLPYQVRTDPYIPIGTAFAVGENLFLSAAHVFSLEYRTLRKELFLRDAEGTVYPVSTVFKYDNARDFILFSTDGLANRQWLEPGSDLNLNDRVFAVGNAYGEGVIIRDGLLTSLTSESENGNWKWLRYSAAVSPGNSGGPLLDGEGRVIGIVTAKSDRENLNYGLPIGEAGEFATGEAKLHLNTVYGLPHVQATYRRIYDYSVTLPMKYDALRARLLTLEETATENSFRKLIEENRGEMFPEDAGSAEALTSNPTTLFPCVYAEKDDSTWTLYQPKETSVAELPGGARLRYGTIWNDAFWQLDVSDRTQVKDLFSDPKLLMDTLLQGNKTTRAVGSAHIRILSYGKPSRAEWIRDRWGRRWLSGAWDIPFSDETVVLMALPVPSGAVGLMRSVDTSRAFAFRLDFEEIVNNVYVCYYSSFVKWTEFLRGTELVPNLFRTAEFGYTAGKSVRFSTESFELVCDGSVIGFSDASAMFLAPSFQKKSGTPVWDVSRAFLYEAKESGTFAAVEKLFRPSETSGEEKKTAWQTVAQKKYPYNRSAVFSGGRTCMYGTVEPKGLQSTEPSLNFLWTVRLSREGELDGEDMKRLFGTLGSGFSLTTGETDAAVYGGPLMVKKTPKPLATIDGMTIFDAVAAGNTAVLKRFILEGKDLAARDPKRGTPLTTALNLGNAECASLLLNAGADPNAIDAYGHAPLDIALRTFPEEFCEMLVSKGADVRRADPEGFTPLMLACARGFAPLAAVVAIRGAPLEPVASNGLSAISFAAASGLSDLVRALALAGAPLDAVDEDGYTLLMAALEKCTPETASLLLRRGAPAGGRTKTGWTSLMYALRYGKSGIAETLLGNAEQLNSANADGWTALHFAARYCGANVARLLVEAGADPMAVTAGGHDPLMIALTNDDKSVADCLLAHPFDPGRTDPEGWTSLTYALRYGTDEQSLAIALVTAEPDAPTRTGWRAIQFALRYGKTGTAAYLIGKGADLSTPAEDGTTPLMAAVHSPSLIPELVGGGANVDAVDGAGDTALHRAVRRSSAGAVRELLRCGADPSVRNLEGRTPKELASGNPKLAALF